MRSPPRTNLRPCSLAYGLMPVRAVHAPTSTDRILTGDAPLETLSAWRREGRGGELVCSVCRTQMVVRAGGIVVPHFAHTHRRDCPTNDDTPERREARQALYRWAKPLIEARGGTVTLEEWVPEAGLPRPIDLCLRYPDGKRDVAVWVHDRPVAATTRARLDAALDGLRLQPLWVFTEGLHRPVEGDDGSVTLTPLERARITATPYDELHGGVGSVHYLVGRASRLRTYRGLWLQHRPGTYRGEVREDPLDDVRLARKGWLVHPGEMEARAAWRERYGTGATHVGTRPSTAWPTTVAGRSRTRAGWTEARSWDPVADVAPTEAVCGVCGQRQRIIAWDGARGRGKCGGCLGQPYPDEP